MFHMMLGLDFMSPLLSICDGAKGRREEMYIECYNLMMILYVDALCCAV